MECIIPSVPQHTCLICLAVISSRKRQSHGSYRNIKVICRIRQISAGFINRSRAVRGGNLRSIAIIFASQRLLIFALSILPDLSCIRRLTGSQYFTAFCQLYRTDFIIIFFSASCQSVCTPCVLDRALYQCRVRRLEILTGSPMHLIVDASRKGFFFLPGNDRFPIGFPNGSILRLILICLRLVCKMISKSLFCLISRPVCYNQLNFIGPAVCKIGCRKFDGTTGLISCLDFLSVSNLILNL